ncbi:MAG: HIT family protein, partial [Promethearchaeota archaeon]
MNNDDSLKNDALFKDSLYASNKAEYVRGKKADVECILCAIRDNNSKISTYKLYQDDDLFIILNMYPFNPGHLMLVPTRHVEKWRELNEKEIFKINKFLKKTQDVMEKVFQCNSFNVGFNEG